MKITKTKLGLAMSAAMALGATTGVQAANLATDGIGQLVYFPYYTTNSGQTTHFKLTNTSDNTVAVKFAVREGANSQDIRDFHIFLSPRDVWTGTISDANGNGIPEVTTSDLSCTAPDKFSSVDPWVNNGDGTFSIEVAQLAGAQITEGYVQAIVMGVSDRVNETNPYSVVALTKHGANGSVPTGCYSVSEALETSSLNQPRYQDRFDSVVGQFRAAENVLIGESWLTNAGTAQAIGLPTTVIANFNNNVNTLDLPDQLRPNVFDATEKVTVLDGDSLGLYFGYTNPGADAVSATILHDGLINQIDVTGRNTAWVVNFPTKRHYQGTGICSEPFPQSCSVSISPIAVSTREADLNTGNTNRSVATGLEEQEVGVGVLDCNPGQFSPPRPCSQIVPENSVYNLTHEVNVISFAGGNPLASTSSSRINIDTLATRSGVPAISISDIGSSGWLDLAFTNARSLSFMGAYAVPDADEAGVGYQFNGNAPISMHGLPAIGFSIDGTAGIATPHRYTRAISH